MPDTKQLRERLRGLDWIEHQDELEKDVGKAADTIEDLEERKRALGQQVETARTKIEDLERKHVAGAAIEQALREATSQLAECYRLTGADPDGASDSMLAKFAIEEVRRLREDHDKAEAVLGALRSEGVFEVLEDLLHARPCLFKDMQPQMRERVERIMRTALQHAQEQVGE